MLEQAIDNLKASAAGVQRSSKPAETKPTKLESSTAKSSNSQTSSGLPPNFFESTIKHPGKCVMLFPLWFRFFFFSLLLIVVTNTSLIR